MFGDKADSDDEDEELSHVTSGPSGESEDDIVTSKKDSRPGSRLSQQGVRMVDFLTNKLYLNLKLRSLMTFESFELF